MELQNIKLNVLLFLKKIIDNNLIKTRILIQIKKDEKAFELYFKGFRKMSYGIPYKTWKKINNK